MSFIGYLALGEGVQKATNQITFANFVAQGEASGILTRKTKNVPLTCPSNPFIKNAYNDLYEYLKRCGVIKSKFAVMEAFFVADMKRHIDPNLTSVQALTPLLESDKLPASLKCYNINVHKLSHLLKNYKYEAVDQVKAVYPGGGRTCHRKSKKAKGKKKRKSKGTEKTQKKYK